MTEASKKLKKECVSIESTVGGSDLDAATLKTLEMIDLCQNEIDNLHVKICHETLKLERKYNQLKKPHFEKRSEFIKHIPNFWFTVIMNHPDLSSIVDEKEEEALQFLNKMEIVDFENIMSGYEIQFHFDENPFFENTMIKKEFNFDSASEPPTSQSTLIKWKEDITKTVNTNSITKDRKRKLESKSFFGWFSDNVDPMSDDIAEIFKEDLWNHPLQYYLVPDMDDNVSAENEDESESSSGEDTINN